MNEHEESELRELIRRFEGMVKKGSLLFDVEEFERISDHYFSSGKINKALKAAEMGEEVFPFSSSFPIKRAQFLLAYDQNEEALRALDRAERMDPENTELLLARAALFSKKGAHKKAIRMYRKAYSRHEFSKRC